MILVGLLVLAGCTGDQQPTDIERQGVQDRARIAAQYIAKAELREAAEVIFPSGYELEELPPTPLNCSTGGVLYGIRFIVHKIDPKKNNDYFDLMKEYWSFMHWEPLNDNRPDAMFMNATQRDYLMSIRAGINGQVAIGNSTPCV